MSRFFDQFFEKKSESFSVTDRYNIVEYAMNHLTDREEKLLQLSAAKAYHNAEMEKRAREVVIRLRNEDALPKKIQDAFHRMKPQDMDKLVLHLGSSLELKAQEEGLKSKEVEAKRKLLETKLENGDIRTISFAKGVLLPLQKPAAEAKLIDFINKDINFRNLSLPVKEELAADFAELISRKSNSTANMQKYVELHNKQAEAKLAATKAQEEQEAFLRDPQKAAAFEHAKEAGQVYTTPVAPTRKTRLFMEVEEAKVYQTTGAGGAELGTYTVKFQNQTVRINVAIGEANKVEAKCQKQLGRLGLSEYQMQEITDFIKEQVKANLQQGT